MANNHDWMAFARKAPQRQRQVVGLMALTVCGAGLLLWAWVDHHLGSLARADAESLPMQLAQLRWNALMAIAAAGCLTLLGAHRLLKRVLAPQQQLLTALRSSESRMAAVVDAAPDAIIGFDALGLITSASPAVASIFGREAHELPGVPITELLPELDAYATEQRALRGQYRRSSDSHVAHWETMAKRHGGTLFPAEVSLARVNGPLAVRYTCVVRDNTERHLAEELLQLYSQALECASNGIVISDVSLPNQPVFYVNPAFEQITGYSAAETVGRNCGFLQGDDRAQAEVKTLVAAVARGESIKVILRNYRKDGSLFFNELALAPVASRGGTAKHYVGVINDVTERERARMAIAEHNARLNAVFDLSPDGFVVFDRDQQLVFVNQAFLSMTGWEADSCTSGLSLAEFDSRLRALHDPKHKCPPLSMEQGDDSAFDTMDLLHLQLPRPRVLTRLVRHNAGGQGESILYFRDVTHETEVDRMKSEFLTTAAHELRTPMVSVFGFTELLLSRPVPEHKRRDVLETIHRQASLLINMVNELLDLARIEARQDREMAFQACSVSGLLHTAVSAMAGRVSPQHQVIVDEVPGSWMVHGDVEKLLRATTNVLSNAQKYSPDGGVIRLGAQASNDGRRIGLWVEDQGIGMSGEQLERVFERFYRADPSGNIPGTGLGMCLVKEIVELHHGEVELHSAPGVGTRVTLHLPAPPGQPATPGAALPTHVALLPAAEQIH
jgi:PAS domain S-box-containing protein